MRMRLEEGLLHADPVDVREALETALADLAGVRLTHGMLLQIAQAEAGGKAGCAVPLDLGALMREIIGLHAPEARDRGIDMSCDCPGESWVGGNRQLLANLLESALK